MKLDSLKDHSAHQSISGGKNDNANCQNYFFPFSVLP